MVTFPAEVDLCNSGRLGDQLALAMTSAATVIADLTATTFCDCSGIRVLVLAHEQALAAAVDLRIVARSASVLRVLALTGADRLLPVYPTVKAALGSGARAWAGSIPDRQPRLVKLRTSLRVVIPSTGWPIFR